MEFFGVFVVFESSQEQRDVVKLDRRFTRDDRAFVVVNTAWYCAFESSRFPKKQGENKCNTKPDTPVVFAQTTIAAHPCKRPLDHPTFLPPS